MLLLQAPGESEPTGWAFKVLLLLLVMLGDTVVKYGRWLCSLFRPRPVQWTPDPCSDSNCVLSFSDSEAGRVEPELEIESLANQIPEILLQSRAPKTVKKYWSAVQRWKDWSALHHLPHSPADPYHVTLYLVHLLQGARTASPVTEAVSAISWYHGLLGIQDPTCNSQVRNVLQAARRMLARPKQRKTPLTRELLQKVALNLLEDESLQSLQVLALITVGFAGLLRWDDLSHIYADEIIVKEEYMAIFLDVRKNDQLRHGHWILISRWDGELCPVSLVERLLAEGDYSGHQLLFGRIRKSSGRRVIRGAMSYSRARELIHDALSRTGVDPASYGLHSLRSGGASVAAAAGVPDRLIQRQGGWRSEVAMRAYFSESLPAMLSVSKALAPS